MCKMLGVKEFAPGTLLGHYKIVRKLGQGGMGVVYEAVDQKLGRHVAVKLLAETIGEDTAALERFWLEARAASSLNHPGISIIHELNESAEAPFIVMELLEGNSLEKAYHGHPMPYPRLLEMGTQLADALDAAHRKGILHRDINPGEYLSDQLGAGEGAGFRRGEAWWLSRWLCHERGPATGHLCEADHPRGFVSRHGGLHVSVAQLTTAG